MLNDVYFGQIIIHSCPYLGDPAACLLERGQGLASNPRRPRMMSQMFWKTNLTRASENKSEA